MTGEQTCKSFFSGVKWWSRLGVGRCCWLEHLGKVDMVSFPLHCKVFIKVLIVDVIEEKSCILFWVEKESEAMNVNGIRGWGRLLKYLA